MKKFFKIMSLFLAAMFILTALAGCQPTAGPSGESSDTPVETDPPKDPLTLTSDYVVVREELCSEAVKDAGDTGLDAHLHTFLLVCCPLVCAYEKSKGATVIKDLSIHSPFVDKDLLDEVIGRARDAVILVVCSHERTRTTLDDALPERI